MMSCRNYLAKSVFLSMCCASQFAHAQFLGDSYFIDPSIVIAKGETGKIELAAFFGDQKFGAAQFSVTFDKSRLQVVNVTPITSNGFAPIIKWRLEDNVLKILSVNGDATANPIGSISVASIEMRAVGEAGQKTQIKSALSAALTSSKSTVAVRSGLSGEITIASATATATALTKPQITVQKISDDAGLREKALDFRRPGQLVTLQVLNPSTGVVTSVQTRAAQVEVQE